MRKTIGIVVLLLLGFTGAFGQYFPQGFSYQTVIRDASGVIISGQSVHLRFSFYSGSPSGTLQWEETQAAVSDAFGLVRVTIGTGASTGAGAQPDFQSVNWQNGLYYLKIALDPANTGSYADMGTTQLFSVPYSLYSLTTASYSNIGLGNFVDVDLSGISGGKLLKWNGSYWMPLNDNDSDTVLFAIASNHSGTSDTAAFVFGNAPDSVLFGYQSGSTVFSANASNTTDAGNSVHSDTAQYAFASAPVAWTLTGNTAGASDYAGTDDSTDLAFRTANNSRLSLKANGKLFIGNPAGIASLHLLGNDGLAAVGAFGSGSLSISGPGDRMIWFPKKAAFRAGAVSGSLWDTASIGNYSMAVGYNTKAGINSFSSGFGCETVDYSFAAGRNSRAMAVGAYPGGNSVALGDSCLANANRTVAMGRGNVCSFSTCVGIGINNLASGSVSLAVGVNCISNGSNSSILGYYGSANSKNGAFVYSDASSNSFTNATANNQFTVRASGGIIFYTDSARTMGVTIFPGSGSWSSVSDVNKKENFENVDPEEILRKVESLKIKSWNYKSQANSIRHIGPMAQDFYGSFGLGESDLMISSIDMDGVILAAIKGLNNRLNELEQLCENETLESKVFTLKNNYISLNNRLDAIELQLKNDY